MNKLFIPEPFYKNNSDKIYDDEFVENYLFQSYFNKKGNNLLQSNQKRFFMFSNKGKFLVYYDEKPNIHTKFKGLYKIENIKNIILEKEKLIIDFNGKKLELTSNENDLKKLKNSLEYLKKYYIKEIIINKLIFTKNDYDLNDLFKINLENEIEKKDLIKFGFDFNDFLIDKKLEKLTEEIPNEILKKRIHWSKVNYSFDNKYSDSFISLNESKTIIIFWISPISIRNFNDEEDFYDNEILSKDIIGNEIDFNFIYFYNYEGKWDISSYIEKININEIDDIRIKEYFENNQFPYQTEIKSNNFSFNLSTKYAFESIEWMSIIKKCQENNNKNLISRLGTLKVNIDLLYKFYLNNSKEEFEKKIVSEYNNILGNYKKYNKQIFQLNKAIDLLNNKMDSIYCIRPFNLNFYKIYLKISYEKILNKIINLWDKKNNNLNANQISELLKLIIKLENILNFWFASDIRIKNSLPNITIYFVDKVYETSIKVIQKFFENNEKKSDLVQIFNTFISEIFYNYEKMKNKELLKSILYLINKLIIYFQNELKNYLEKNKTNDEILININNCILKFIIKQKEFINYIKINSNINEDNIKLLLKENKLIFNYVNLGNISIDLIGENLLNIINNRLKNSKNVIDIDFTLLLNDLKKFSNKYWEKLNKFHVNKLFKTFLDEFFKMYLNLFIISIKNKSSNKNLVEKIKDHYNQLEEFFEDKNLNTNLLEILLKKINTLIQFIEQKNISILLLSLVNLNVFTNNTLNIHQLKLLVNFKSDIKKENLKYLLSHLENFKPNKKFKKIINQNKINWIVIKFIIKLKLKLKNIKNKLKNKEIFNEIINYLNKNINIYLDFNDYINLKFWESEKNLDTNDLELLLKKIDNEKLFITFDEDTIYLFTNNSKKNLQYNLKLKNCKFLKFYNDLTIYLKIENTYFEITHENIESMKKIFKNLKYLKSKFDDVKIKNFSIIDSKNENEVLFKKY